MRPIVPQRRLRAAFGVTSRMPHQSLAAEMLLVWASPAVGAASVTSPGSTWPGRPDLGTSSQTTPSSASAPIASTSASTRSPSSSRHQRMTTSATSSVSSSTISPPEMSTIESRRSSSASSSQPSSCTTMPGLMPSRAAKPALSTLIRAAPPWGGPAADRSWVDGALSGRRTRADASRVPVQIAGTVGGGDHSAAPARHDGGHDRREGSPPPGHVTPSLSRPLPPRPAYPVPGPKRPHPPAVRPVIPVSGTEAATPSDRWRKRRAWWDWRKPARRGAAPPTPVGKEREHVTRRSQTGDDGHMSAPQQTDGDPARGPVHDTGAPRAVITDGLPSQLPDIDPDETQEWLDSLDAVVGHAGRDRARYLMLRMLERSREQQVGVPSLRSTDYINSIPPQREPWFPGNEDVERRIRAYIRWNAAIMVHRAQRPGIAVGGHISSYASSASLYEVGFNHFFRGKDHPGGGDQIWFQGHASPGIYARAYLEGRLSEQQLDGFRQEVSHPGGGLSSYPHPRLMSDFWEFPTVSMGLGPLNAIYQARFNRYLHGRGIKDTSDQHVWAFLGDGEMDEPESLGAIGLAAREELDNLTFVINCNLQRLDGPVRGNGKIIQELESFFRGAGWNVIKVIWGRQWDP